MLRRLAFAILLSLAPGMTWAQGPCYLCYTPPSSAGGGTWGSITGTLSAQTDLSDALTARPTITASASYPTGACTPGNLWRVTGVNYLFQCGPNAIWDYSRRNTTGNVFYFYGAWTDSTNNEGISITATPGQDTQFQNFTDGTGTDNIGFNFIPAGTGTFKIGTTLFVVSSTAVTSTVPIQGSKSKALTDNVATAFATMAMPQTAGSNYGGGKIIYTIFCKDASNQATQSGTVTFACHNLAGAESCGFGTPDGVTLGDGTGSLGTPVFTAAAGADLVTISVRSDCTGITPTTHTIESRADLPHVNTWTPIP